MANGMANLDFSYNGGNLSRAIEVTHVWPVGESHACGHVISPEMDI